MLILTAMLLGVAAAAWAQDPGTGAVADSSSLPPPPARGASLIPLPILFYQPETGTGFGASVIYLFEPEAGTDAGQEARSSFQSSIGATVIYTTKEQLITAIQAELYPDSGRYRAVLSIAFQRFPDSFWGIGNHAPDSLEEDYTAEVFAAGGEFQMRAANNTFAGVFGQIANRQLQEVEEGGLIAAAAVPGTEDGTLLRFGALLTRDSRGSNVFPKFGEYHQLRASHSVDVSGNDNDFSTFSFDLRTFLPIRSGVLALRALGIATVDEPPFDLMPQLGGESLLRGYFAGRFRDRNLNAFQVEYRGPMWRRVRGVAFGGVGQVAHDFAGLRFDDYHPSAGFGARFLLNRKEELELRMDFGWGFDAESSGFYIGVGQVF